MARDHGKFRNALRSHRIEVLAVKASTENDRAPRELDQTRVGRLSRMDALQAQAMSTAVDQRRNSEIRRIDAALARIADDEYGYCLSCGEEIELKRLELDPAVMQCATCATGSS